MYQFTSVVQAALTYLHNIIDKFIGTLEQKQAPGTWWKELSQRGARAAQGHHQRKDHCEIYPETR